MGICAFCGKPRAKFTTLLHYVPKAGEFQKVYRIGDDGGYLILTHQKCTTTKGGKEIIDDWKGRFWCAGNVAILFRTKEDKKIFDSDDIIANKKLDEEFIKDLEEKP